MNIHMNNNNLNNTSNSHATTIGMLSLGCAKNRVDAEMLMGTLKNAGYKLTSDLTRAEVVIVNTCGFIEDAKRESIEEILDLVKIKDTQAENKQKKLKGIIVTGCLAERYKNEVLVEIPEVDAVIGIGNNSDIVSVVEKVLEGEKVELFSSKENLSLNGERVQSTPSSYAYLKVADGCDNCCTYCAIPLIRGQFRSRKMEDIILEAKSLAEKGVRELLVIAQDTTRYGEDIYGQLKLPDLLRQLCEIESIEWIRVLYCYPDRITDELIETIATENKIVKYLDLPLQHCNKRILKLMNRRGNRESLTQLIHKIKKRIPEIAIRTTFIVGFPSETNQEFIELQEFCKEIKFERMGCFTYSQEEDTPAAILENQIDEEIKSKRQELLMNQQINIINEISQRLIGKTMKIIVEGFDHYENCFWGRSYMDAPEVDGKIFLDTKEKKPIIGDFIQVKITSCKDYDLEATII